MGEDDDKYTKDGTVDHHGNPADRSKTGTWKACPFILGNECCERLAYYGMSTNLNWGGTCYITPLIGAFIADSYLGRYWTIALFSVIYVFGMTLLTLSASSPWPKANVFWKRRLPCNSYTKCSVFSSTLPNCTWHWWD
ncbi:hypothetical protein CMV_025422 [Castanea mollissima]|uniref:Peptide transporter n=1 Tax=Castanea mollissima TaxID=60419 RepID=A0A8J4QM04_9ROSI|nr:hypothetical protein CMV_025422 [Castanea mollissima]